MINVVDGRIGKIIHTNNIGFFQETLAQMRTDKPGTPGYQYIFSFKDRRARHHRIPSSLYIAVYSKKMKNSRLISIDFIGQASTHPQWQCYARGPIRQGIRERDLREDEDNKQRALPRKHPAQSEHWKRYQRLCLPGSTRYQ